ncbi:uncharacterized protein LOC136034068 [Artemia franciscana]|uniref:uncharacterized protein LOC136034068 n=1 Tax=Artemia franciscana TaxID=6661 RepID=UPI0032DB8406
MTVNNNLVWLPANPNRQKTLSRLYRARKKRGSQFHLIKPWQEKGFKEMNATVGSNGIVGDQFFDAGGIPSIESDDSFAEHMSKASLCTQKFGIEASYEDKMIHTNYFKDFPDLCDDEDLK